MALLQALVSAMRSPRLPSEVSAVSGDTQKLLLLEAVAMSRFRDLQSAMDSANKRQPAAKIAIVVANAQQSTKIHTFHSGEASKVGDSANSVLRNLLDYQFTLTAASNLHKTHPITAWMQSIGTMMVCPPVATPRTEAGIQGTVNVFTAWTKALWCFSTPPTSSPYESVVQQILADIQTIHAEKPGLSLGLQLGNTVCQAEKCLFFTEDHGEPLTMVYSELSGIPGIEWDSQAKECAAAICINRTVTRLFNGAGDSAWECCTNNTNEEKTQQALQHLRGLANRVVLIGKMAKCTFGASQTAANTKQYRRVVHHKQAVCRRCQHAAKPKPTK